MTVVLASTSRIRRALLENAGVSVEVMPPAVDEAELKRRHSDLTTAELAIKLSSAKALSVTRAKPGAIVIGADQIMECGNDRLDKPPTLKAARTQLLSLRGKTHRLISAASCIGGSGQSWSHVAFAELVMREFSERFLDHYLEEIGSGATQSVGAYQLESLGIQLFEDIRGDYFTILGLPLLPLLSYLRSAGELTA